MVRIATPPVSSPPVAAAPRDARLAVVAGSTIGAVAAVMAWFAVQLAQFVGAPPAIGGPAVVVIH